MGVLSEDIDKSIAELRTKASASSINNVQRRKIYAEVREERRDVCPYEEFHAHDKVFAIGAGRRVGL